MVTPTTGGAGLDASGVSGRFANPLCVVTHTSLSWLFSMRCLSYHCAGVEGGLVAPEVPDLGKLSADVPSVGGGVYGSLPGISADASMPSVDVDVPSGSLDIGGKLRCCGVDEVSVPGGRGSAFDFVVVRA